MSEESNKNSKDENNVGDGGMLTKKKLNYYIYPSKIICMHIKHSLPIPPCKKSIYIDIE